MLEIPTKVCCDCKEEKILHEFHKNRHAHDKHDHYCIKCKRKRASKYETERLRGKTKDYPVWF